METKHYEERKTRNEFIENTISIDKDLDTFYWDKSHPNGPEYHTVTDTGIIKIHNVRTGKHITNLIGRPQQIKRYYIAEGRECPKELLDIAYQHFLLGYNNK